METKHVFAATVAAVALVGTVALTGTASTVGEVSGSASCTTDAGGYCTVQHHLGTVPTEVLLTASVPTGARSYMLTNVRGAETDSTFRVRAVLDTGKGAANQTLWFSYELRADPPAPPPSSSESPSSTSTTTPPSSTPPPAAEYPTADTTGVPAGTVFDRTIGYYEATTAGELIDRVHTTSAILVSAPGVVISNSQVDDTIVVGSGGSVTVTDTTIGPTCGGATWYPYAIGPAQYTALRVEVRGHEDGFGAGGSNVTVRDSFVDICGHTGDHADGIQDYPRVDGLIFDHNTVDMRGESGANAPVFVNAGDQGQQVSRDVSITDNLVAGGAYGVRLWPGDGTWTVTGNRVVAGSAAYGEYTASGRCALLDQWADNDTVTIDGNYRVTGTVADNVPCN